MKFKLDGPEFKFRALEFFTTSHLVKTKYVAVFCTFREFSTIPPKNTRKKAKM